MIERIGNHISLLGEGPVWDELSASILWVDIINGHIHEYAIEAKAERMLSLGEMVGVIAPYQTHSFIAGLKTGFAIIDRRTGAIEKIHDPEQHLPENRFNDGKCDPAGRFWAGTMPLSENQPTGSLYMLGRDRNVHRMVTGITISNGLAWSHDQRYMYYIDTPTLLVARFDYDQATGSIGERRIAFRIPVEEGYPDGMTIDADGMLWIAHWGGWQLTRWDPVAGKKIYSIRLPVSNVTSCTFGGKDFSEIYVTSARKGLSAEQISQQPLAGATFVIHGTGFKGLPAHRYLG